MVLSAAGPHTTHPTARGDEVMFRMPMDSTNLVRASLSTGGAGSGRLASWLLILALGLLPCSTARLAGPGPTHAEDVSHQAEDEAKGESPLAVRVRAPRALGIYRPAAMPAPLHNRISVAEPLFASSGIPTQPSEHGLRNGLGGPLKV